MPLTKPCPTLPQVGHDGPERWTMSDGFPRISAMGISGVLVSFSDTLSEPANRAAIAFRSRVAEDAPTGVLEVAVTLASVFLRIEPSQTSADALRGWWTTLLAERDWMTADLPSGRRLWRIPTVFGGPDGPQLEEAAHLAGIAPEQAVTEMCAEPVRVLALGFAPGQPYLGTLGGHWDIPRQTGITPAVPAGALVVAVRQFVLFANSAPTGWRQVGRTAFRCYAGHRERPIALRPGDLCQFVEISPSRLSDIEANDPDLWGGATWEDIP